MFGKLDYGNVAGQFGRFFKNSNLENRTGRDMKTGCIG